MNFFAFEFKGNRDTTCGNPNPHSGAYSKAGYLAIFSQKSERALWVNQGKITSEMSGNCRIIVSPKEARRLLAGFTPQQYKRFIELRLNQEAIAYSGETVPLIPEQTGHPSERSDAGVFVLS